MYSVYLIEQLSSVSNLLFSGTNDIEITSANTIILKTGNYYEIKRGMYIRINSGEHYIINDFTYSALNDTYKFIISGVINTGILSNAVWQIFAANTSTNHIQLDTEDVEISTVFAVSDIADISSRKDSITKNIAIKGTPTNNSAFGHLFLLNKYTDIKLSNKLFFNYTPIRKVDCLVYDEGMLILKGNLIVTQIDVDKNNNVVYQCTITGKVINFKSVLDDKLVSDLNFNDMEHQYTALEIVDSWGGKNDGSTNTIGNSRTYWTDLNNGNVYTKNFEPGVGYLYPTIDYGEKFRGEQLNLNYEHYKIQNYRPAIWLREYFNRIFKDAGFTYEIKGSPDFISKFNKLFIPDSRETFTSYQKGIGAQFNMAGPIVVEGDDGGTPVRFNPVWFYNEEIYTTPIQFLSFPVTDLLEIDNQLYPNVPNFEYPNDVPVIERICNLLRVKKNFNSDGRIKVKGTFKQNKEEFDGQYFYIQFARRTRPDTYNGEGELIEDTKDNVGEFEVLAEQAFQSKFGEVVNFDADILLPNIQYNKGEQLIVRLTRNETNLFFDCTITEASIVLPKDANTLYNVEIEVGDKVVPATPENIKQYDLVMSVIKLFNLYVYPDKDRDNHLIFETYDDFYGFATLPHLRSNALDWTNKIDYSKGFKAKSNLSIPKKYQFTFKDDNDFLNKGYKEKYGEAFGTFKFNDSYGFTDEKKVEVLFSQTPSVMINGSYKMSPFLTSSGINLIDKKKTKTNIRLLYYNGVHAFEGNKVGDDNWDGSTDTWRFNYTFGSYWYAQCSNYLFDVASDIHHTPYTDGKPSKLVPIADLHFGYPKEYYFNVDDSYVNVDNGYSYFINQTSELTNANMFTMTCEVLLNEADIANLDLKVPVFIDMGDKGYSYFKVLSVEYTNSSKTSTAILQKVI